MTGRDDVFASAMKEGHSAAWEQDWNRAADFYKTALQEFPDNPKALNSFAQALFESDRLEESLQVYEQAARSSPADPFPFLRGKSRFTATRESSPMTRPTLAPPTMFQGV